MTLEEILQIEAQNVDCIFLYQEEGAWYAYEHSAFYCYSLLGILDIDWLPCPDGVSSGQKTIRVRVSEPDKFLCTPLLRLMRKRKTEYVVLCKISCGGFYYWREQQQMKFRVLQESEREEVDRQHRGTSQLHEVAQLRQDDVARREQGCREVCTRLPVFSSGDRNE